MTRKGSKQLTDEERASQVASPTRSLSPTIPPGEAEDNGPGGSPFFTPEIMQGVQEAQKKRAKMTPKERAIDIEKTRLIMGMLPMAIVRQMKADDKKRVERDKQRANTKGSAASEPLKIDNDDAENENDSDNDKREDDLFSDDSNADPDKGGYRDPDDNDPDDNDPGDDSDPDKD